jgi:hypothetical protein
MAKSDGAEETVAAFPVAGGSGARGPAGTAVARPGYRR